MVWRSAFFKVPFENAYQIIIKLKELLFNTLDLFEEMYRDL